MQSKRNTWLVPSHRAVWIPPNLAHRVEMFGIVMMQTLYFHPTMKVYSDDHCQAVNVSNLMRELIIHTCGQGIISPDSQENRSLINFLVGQAKAMDSAPFKLQMPVDERAVQAANSILSDPSKSLSAVVLATGCSTRTLQRIFPAETGLSFGRWRSQARLLTALRLLESGRSVTSVALDLGFDSMSAFISAFRKFFGVTPGKFYSADLSD